MKISKSSLNSYKVYNVIFTYLKMNNIFKLRMVNKNYEKFANNFLGFYVYDISNDLVAIYKK